MVHPNTQIKFISDEIGYGVFATAFMPKGTITYVKDSMELEISPSDFYKHNAVMQEQIEKYSYIDEKGFRIVSWDFAKYVNHCCDCNTMSTGYGFEIAIRDIQEGEQITDEYGIFNMTEAMTLNCSRPGCRGMVCRTDLDKHFQEWDAKLLPALLQFKAIEQPLAALIDEETLQKVQDLAFFPERYQSVFNLKYHQSNGVVA